MLTSVEITNYRGFQSYKLGGLGQVNLLVGKNNSGKTALVEAIHLITSGGDPIVLSDTAQRRGELTMFGDTGRMTSDLTHFFHGHVLSADSSFTLRSDNGYPALTVRLVPIPEDPTLFAEDDEELEAHPAFGVIIEGAVGFGSESKDVRLSERGGLIFSPLRLRMRQAAVGSAALISAPVFVPSDSLSARRLPQLWRQVVLDSNQGDVVTAMSLIEGSIKQIHYLPPDAGRNVVSSRDWYVQTTESARPVPLGSFGDGMRRLMVLALALARAGNSTLLVDEIDTGLHYSVMADMWRLVIKKAVLSNVQVFATTHSWDCIQGLAQLCEREPSLTPKVAIQKVDRAIPHSIAFSGESVVRMTKSDIDPR